MGPTGLVIIGAVVVVLLATIAFALLRRSFAKRYEAVEQAWRQVHAELVRRQDTAGRLLDVARGRFDQEELLRARAHAVAARGSGPVAQSAAEARLTRALGGFFQAAQAHPDLVADNGFRMLRWQLGESEHRIAAGVQAYNAMAHAYNARFSAFPARLGKGKHPQSQLYP
ncbi:LemA family protein [Labedaea rhizosphaerae]|uniref:LemA protein n=1 Tax=Labedaea rhizosphaerae TaxID=598644 RepID=A0A4R6SMU1_LABRH|nr:LemA family protein [Labedaea rhizosphaerae]TDQ05327.1 LemA protein [Labedaea rhizosphaerae]